MIRNFRHKGLAALYFDDQSKGVQQAHVKRLRQILILLDTAATPEDMNAPGLRLHPLKGNLQGAHAVSVSGNWRVTFRFEDGRAEDLNLEDYH